MPRASSRNSDHLVPDLLAPGLDLVFCGTAPSPASFKARAYYANPGNAFWPTLHAVGLTPERFTPQRYPELLAWRIGLTDLNKTEYGSDHELSAGAMDAGSLHAKLRRYRPAAIAFTSKNAASLGPRRQGAGLWPAGRPAGRRGGLRARLAVGPRALVLDAGAVARGRRLRGRTAPARERAA